MPAKAKTIKVTATRGLDWINEGETAEVDNDEQVQNLITGGYLVEADKAAEVTSQTAPDDGSRPL